MKNVSFNIMRPASLECFICGSDFWATKSTTFLQRKEKKKGGTKLNGPNSPIKNQS